MDTVKNLSIKIKKYPWTRSMTRSMKVVHGPGPKWVSMDPWSMFCPHPVKISKQNKFARAAHFFVHFLAVVLHDCNVKLLDTSYLEEMSYVFSFTFFHCRSFSPCIWLVAASISHFFTAAAKFSCCSSNKKVSPFFFSRSRSLSLFCSLSLVGLPPTFSFSLSLSCSIFQLCGNDN